MCTWLHQHFANNMQQTIEISLGISWERSWRSTPARCWAAFACAWALKSSTCTVEEAQNGTEGIAKPEHKERSAWIWPVPKDQQNGSPNYSLMEGEEKCKIQQIETEQQNLVSTNCKAWEPWPWLLRKQCRYPRSVPAHAKRAWLRSGQVPTPFTLTTFARLMEMRLMFGIPCFEMRSCLVDIGLGDHKKNVFASTSRRL